MAKKSSVEKNKHRLKMVNAKWEKRQALKDRSNDINLSDEERMLARIALNKMPRNSSIIRVRNRCAMTGRARGYLRRFQLSRLTFREMANQGLIPGVTKASW